ncbi:hypothetical protein CDG61_07420 [Acinetobacter sp. WCHAc010052]|nr:hypothetical protein [Acinetobacter sp. WCHAc010052]AXY61725.1 hypothetical protein CDG61_07420 [Acinetobacter sp. WCHAc010052]
MIGQTREILANLGIDVWIPRENACQQMPEFSLWRDQSEPVAVDRMVEFPQVSLPEPGHSDIPESVVKSRETEKPDVVLTPKSDTAVQENLPRVISTAEPVHIPPFCLQAISLEHCAVVLNATVLSQAEQHLWVNIQNACSAQFYELKWPFPLVEIQDGRGVASYVQGFLDAVSSDKNLLSLGEIPHCSASKVIQLADLQSMLERPLLKKRLWQFMQKSVSDHG